MPPGNYGALADQAADRYGIPRGIYRALINQESGWNPKAGSPAGAEGLVQIHLPSHPDVTLAQAQDPAFALDWGARYLASQYKTFGTWRQALAAYNAGPGRVKDGSWLQIGETTRYVKNILGAAGDYKTSAPGPGVAAAGAGVPSDPSAPAAFPALDLKGPMLEGLADITAGNFDPVAQLSKLGLAHHQQAAAALAGQYTPTVPGQPAAAPTADAPFPTASGPTANPNKWLNLPTWGHASGAAEPNQPILNFAASIGKRLGRPLQVWDTTGHDKMTTNGRVSAHWIGNALDLPATGATLIRMGRIALMQAGMPRKQAMKAGPGLYNIGGYQIIFGTNSRALGGDHTDHLHVGIRS